MLGGPVGGYLTDKVFHSATKYLRVVFVITGTALAVFAFLPHSHMNVYFGMLMTLSIGAVYSACAPSSLLPWTRFMFPGK